MANFLRVVRLALRHRLMFVAAFLCALGVGLLWGVNFGLTKPIVEILFAGKPPHAWADEQVSLAQEKIVSATAELAEIDQQFHAVKAAEQPGLAARRDEVTRRLALHREQLAGARWLAPLVKRYLPNGTFAALVLIVGLVVVSTLVKDLLLVLNLLLVEQLTQRSVFDLRQQLFRQTLRMEMAHFGREHSSQIMHYHTADLQCVTQAVSIVFGRMILEPLKIVACLAGAALICWKLLLVSLIVVPVAAYVLVRLTHTLKRANRRALEEMEQLYTLLSETLTNIQSVKAFGMERTMRRRFRLQGKSVFRKAVRIAFFGALGRASTEFMGVTMICVAFAGGVYLWANPQTTLFGMPILDEPLSLGSMLAFYALLAGIGEPSRKLSEVMNNVQRGVAASDRIFEILDSQPTIVDPPMPKTIATSQPELVFDRISFQYQSGEPVLRNVELRIPFGQTVAIVGPNGCGKSTLVNLVPRFYDPSEGVVRLDGVDLRELRLRELRGMIGLVAQQALLFDDTIRNNIRYGSPHATDSQVMAAAEKAHAHGFITQKLADGYDTIVGERGGRLSGGQRQRILLARAILRDPKFLILDEATSQIDLESEQLIHRVLEQFRRGRTTLLITHRTSSIALADRIVVMDAGRIIDEGTHDELVHRCALYNRLNLSDLRQTA